IAAQRAQGIYGKCPQVGAVETDRAVRDAARRCRQEAHDRERGDALAATGLANEPQGATGLEREADAVDNRHLALVGEEACPQSGDVEECCHFGMPATHSISIFMPGKARRLTSTSVLAGFAAPKNSCRTGLILCRSSTWVRNTVTFSTWAKSVPA